jgi:undecaprenyl-diphosphatase
LSYQGQHDRIIEGFEITTISSRRTWYVLGALFASCILLPALLNVREIVDLDARLFLDIHERYDADLHTLLQFFTELGSIWIWLLFIPLLWIGRKKDVAVRLLFALTAVVLIGYSMKYAIDRPRPYEVISYIDPLLFEFDPSFPSGHTMTAFAGAVVLGTRWRKALLPLLVLATVIGISRVYIGVHYPLDVFSGALIGILIGLLIDSLDMHEQVDWINDRLIKLADLFGADHA